MSLLHCVFLEALLSLAGDFDFDVELLFTLYFFSGLLLLLVSARAFLTFFSGDLEVAVVLLRT